MENTIDQRQSFTKQPKLSPTKQLTLGLDQHVIVDGSQEESVNYAASQESIQKITDQVLSSGNFILSENQQVVENQKKESTALVERFQNDQLQNFMPMLDGKNNETNSSRISPTNKTLSAEDKPNNNSTLMQQYTTRQNPEPQRVDETTQVKNINDLKSLSSNEEHRLAPVQQSDP